MKRAAVHAVLVLLGLVAVAAGGAHLWRHRPWRPAVAVNGRVLSAGELDLRARALAADARRLGRPLSADAARRTAAKMWIVKEVLLAEALARGYAASAADEKAARAQMAARLKSRRLTPEAFFREGPLPEEVKQRDFREGVLIDVFVAREVRDKMTLTTEEVDARLAELRRRAPASTRRQALDALRVERFRAGFRRLFRSLFVKCDVRSPAFPAFEALDGLLACRRAAASAGNGKESDLGEAEEGERSR